MRPMLTTGTMTSSSLDVSAVSSSAYESSEDSLNSLSTYLHSLAGYIDVEVDAVLQDHCYTRPWNWKPENIYVKPIKKIFFSSSHELFRNRLNTNGEIDVEHCDYRQELILPFDLKKSRQSVEESQKLANFARPNESADDWIDKIEKTFWSPLQRRLFTRVFHILCTEHLTRLTKINISAEPIYRRISTDSTTQKFREILASTDWDLRIIQWLHGLLLDNLPREYLVIYLDILQTLRAKVPQLVEKMVATQSNTIVKPGSIPSESLTAVLKRSWDPVMHCLNSSRPKKLPGNPIIIVVPSGIDTHISSRQHKWITNLGSLGMVVTIHSNLGLSASKMTMTTYMEQLVQTTRAKIQDVRNEYPGRAILLIGYNTGAALACQVAQMEHLTAVVCLGFLFATVEGNRGSPDDTLLDIRCPILFIVGKNAKLSKIDDIEDIREKLPVESNLIVIGTADDHLRVSTVKKNSCGITQSMVDRCILDEIADFVANIILQPHPLPLRPVGFCNLDKITKKEQRKRKNSTSSSIGSESSFSNAQKKSRPSTPVDRISITTNQTSQSLSKSISPLTQATFAKVKGINNVNYVPIQKQKSKTVNIHKTGISEQSTSLKRSGQMSSTTSNGGLTLNIGSLASLGSGGPIKLGPYVGSQNSNLQMKSNNSPKHPVTLANVSKMIDSNDLPNPSGKIKTITPTTKIFHKSLSTNNKSVSHKNRAITSNSNKNINIQEKSEDLPLVAVLATSRNQVKVTNSTSSVIQNKSAITTSTHLTTLLHRKNVSGNNNSERFGPIPSLTGLHSNDSSDITATTIITSTTTTKAMERSSLMNTNFTSSINQTRITENISDSVPFSTFAMNENTDSSIIILPCTSKTNDCQKNVQMAQTNLINQSNQLKKSQLSLIAKRDSSIDIDKKIGNILDMPIIFAKDVDNWNTIEKASPPNISCVSQQNISTKIPSTAKVVLLSNKERRVYCPPTKIHAKVESISANLNISSEYQNAIRCTRLQSSAVHNSSWNNVKNFSKSKNSTIKYTKIILSKQSSGVFNSVNDQVI